MGRPFLIYKVFKGSNLSLFFDLQRSLQGEISLPFRFSVFLECEMTPSLFDLQGFYIIERFSYDLEK